MSEDRTEYMMGHDSDRTLHKPPSVEAVLRFDLTDREGQERFRRTMKADDMCYVLHALCEGCEWSEGVPAAVSVWVRRACADNNINFEEIWT